MVEAVIFDLDGVLVDTQQMWDQAMRAFVQDHGGRWSDDAPLAMIGMSSPEWSAYLQNRLGVPLSPEHINRGVVARMEQQYRSELPLMPGAEPTVRSIAARWRAGLASSANRELIDLVLELSGLADAFQATVSSDEVGRGKPAPDVYLEAASRLEIEPANTVAVEDSGHGLLSARTAGMLTIAIPNRLYPPDPDVLADASAVIATLQDLTPELLAELHR